MLRIEISEKKFGETPILKDLHICLEKNGLYGVVGKNGAGKTTFFKCLSHLTDYQGRILLNNAPISSENIGFIPTEPYLYEHLIVREFHFFYAKMLGIPVKNMPIFEIDPSRLIKELSTGMRKKAYINAVFQKNYDIYIFDEPFNGLDIESVYELRKIIMQFAENHIVFISSHLLESLKDCACIFLLKPPTMQTILPENYSQIESILFHSH